MIDSWEGHKIHTQSTHIRRSIRLRRTNQNPLALAGSLKPGTAMGRSRKAETSFLNFPTVVSFETSLLLICSLPQTGSLRLVRRETASGSPRGGWICSRWSARGPDAIPDDASKHSRAKVNIAANLVDVGRFVKLFVNIPVLLFLDPFVKR